MQDFDLPAAIDLLAKQTDTINNLWTVYVAATFAAGGFNGLDGIEGRARTWVAAALTVAFLTFTVGHGFMIWHELVARATLGKQIMEDLEGANASLPFRGAMQAFAKVADVPSHGMAVHLLIDVCVVAAIWIRALVRRKPLLGRAPTDRHPAHEHPTAVPPT